MPDVAGVNEWHMLLSPLVQQRLLGYVVVQHDMMNKSVAHMRDEELSTMLSVPLVASFPSLAVSVGMRSLRKCIFARESANVHSSINDVLDSSLMPWLMMIQSMQKKCVVELNFYKVEWRWVDLCNMGKTVEKVMEEES
ncbi:uncharacterized protein MONOS_10902 [Monocercomonoides exilis]|uniref:uncharacterized protein n=1 Tax=Monocercomonoides exilis TaxID=2049356 RepID=UPI00355A0DBD|nr:hypothetical protein MONOS_10902 [Monocercomonoides exilis]|eukprot:MONOS_10902.1-p1 / transcript=MONOS_10902.1 / gene=MONOS_10902 / organism=Monocercomonoides_exilis_PA203 / gene_product=unspecified product / transcript_product=unspecified product / location=Mono_scaffold00516:38179-38595(-) / protein_length=139 / sequence_SO=supercontig / SO=protein_coding / is_pseudo=false